jgi:chromosome segregation ATPase
MDQIIDGRQTVTELHTEHCRLAHAEAQLREEYEQQIIRCVDLQRDIQAVDSVGGDALKVQTLRDSQERMKNLVDELAGLREAVQRTSHVKLQLTQLVDLCEVLTLQNNSKASHIAALYAKCMHQARELVQTESKLQQAQSELGSLRGECTRISQLDSIRAECIDRVRQEVDEALQERSEAEARCIALLEKLAQAERKIRELQATMSMQTGKLELEQKTRRSLEQESDGYRSKVSELEAAVLSLEHRNNELLREEETRTFQIEQAVAQAGEEGRHKMAAQLELDEARTSLARILPLEAELACMRDQLRASDHERCALRSRLEASSQRIAGLEQMADHSTSVCRSLEAASVQSVAALQRELVACKLQLQQMAAIKPVIEVLESQIRASEIEIARLRTELPTSSNSTRLDRENWCRPIEARIDKLTERLKRTCSELQSFQQANGALQADLHAANTTIAKLRTEVMTAHASSNQAAADLRVASSTIAQLQSDLNVASTHAEQLKSELAGSQNEISKLVDKAATLSSSVDHLTSELEIHKALYPKDWKLVLATAQKASHFEKDFHALRAGCRCLAGSSAFHGAHAKLCIDATSLCLQSSAAIAIAQPDSDAAVKSVSDCEQSIMESSLEQVSRQLSCALRKVGSPSKTALDGHESSEVGQACHSALANCDAHKSENRISHTEPQEQLAVGLGLRIASNLGEDTGELEIRRRIQAELELSNVVRHYGGTVQDLKRQFASLVASFNADSLRRNEELLVLRRAFTGMYT